MITKTETRHRIAGLIFSQRMTPASPKDYGPAYAAALADADAVIAFRLPAKDYFSERALDGVLAEIQQDGCPERIITRGQLATIQGGTLTASPTP